MANNKIKEKDAFDVMFQMIDENPDITTDEIAERLAEEGYANSAESVRKFFVAIGIES